MIKTNNIIILGGGSAGWMTATTLINRYPEKNITVIESPSTPITGVGESTIGQFNDWLAMVGIEDKDFMPHTDASYKLSIKFTDFYKKGETFHYPFGELYLNDLTYGHNNWFYKKNKSNDDYSNFLWPQMALVNNNTITTNDDNIIPNFTLKRDAAYHFDAIQFATWLREEYCKPRGVKHIVEDITDIKIDDDGIVSLNNYEADLYFDCTGFKSSLLGKSLNEEFESYSDILPNNSAWATRLPYNNKKEDINCYTNCTAIENGWVWQIPLWSRWGTGYVYSDKFVDDENALQEFKNHLDKKGQDYSNAEFKKIKMRVGIHKRLWVKNVVAIGLAAGFIEPLESNGLFSVHEFLMRFIRNAQRDIITQWDRDNFTFHCKKLFRNFAEFVAMHYAMSNRDDTEYWKANANKEWEPALVNLTPANELGFYQAVSLREYNNYFLGDGLDCIAYGMEWYPTEATHIKWLQGFDDEGFKNKFSGQVDELNKRKGAWDMVVKDKTSFYDYHKQKFYNDRED